MPSFNLVDEPWIPCIWQDGRVEELGLRETLLRSHEIREIVDPAPPITVALHRLLLAIAHRNVGPPDADAWERLWQAGAWDAALIGDYLDRWRHRFDLFDAERPFYQVPHGSPEAAAPITKLTHELASPGNAVTLFDHTLEVRFTPAQAARYLVAYHAFCVGGLVSSLPGEDRSRVGSADAGPLTKTAVTLVKGRNLFQTLTLNLIPYSPEEGEPFPVTGDDLPAWEQADLPRPEDRLPTGYLDLLTWQGRRIRLFHEEDARGQVVVYGTLVMKGWQFSDDWKRDREPMIAFRENKKAKSGESPWTPLAFQEDRAIWRDSLALTQAPQGYQQPRTLTWLGELANRGILDRATILPVDLYGVNTDQANVLFWRHERLPLPVGYLEDEDLVDRLRQALGFAEAAAEVLDRATRHLAELLLSPGADQRNGRQPDRAAVTALASNLAPGRGYWQRLDAPFRALVVDLAAAAPESRDDVLIGWIEVVRRAALAAFSAVADGLDGSARALKAQARADRLFRGLLRQRLPEMSRTPVEGGVA